MKRILSIACVSLAGLGYCGGISAPVTLIIDNPYQTSIQGYAATLTFTGSINVDDNYRATVADIEAPSLTFSVDDPSATLGPVTLSSSLLAYLQSAGDSTDYVGDLFTVQIDPTKAIGDYFYNPGTVLPTPEWSELVVYAARYDGTDIYEYNSTKIYGVTLATDGEPSVPGPAAALPMAAGLGLAALRKRRHK